MRGAAVGALACVLLAGCSSDIEAPVGQAPGVSSAAPTAPAVEAPVAQAVAISIPAIEAFSSLVPVGLRPDGTLDVPPVEQPEQAAYYDDAPMPGATGPALVVGHVNGGGRDGVFARLPTLAVGDEVLIERAEAPTARFLVTRVEKVDKDGFPWDRVLADTAGPELRLVTCGGEFNRVTGHYEDNWIVWAVAA